MADDGLHDAADAAPFATPSVTSMATPDAGPGPLATGDEQRSPAVTPHRAMVPLRRGRLHRLHPRIEAAVTVPHSLPAIALAAEPAPAGGTTLAPARPSVVALTPVVRAPAPLPPGTLPPDPFPSAPAPDREPGPEPGDGRAGPGAPAPATTRPPRPPRPRTAPAGSPGDAADQPWAATTALLAGARRRLRVWWPRWTARGLRRALAVGAAVIVLLVTGLTWGATSWVQAAIRDIGALDPNSAAIQDPVGQSGDQNYLVVGSDTRVGATPADDVGTASDIVGARSDTVMVVHVPADRSRVTVVSFPRDLEIDRPACERWDSTSGAYTGQYVPVSTEVKLNTAYQAGGPRCVVKAVQELSGLAINHFLAVDFTGFKDMVDAVGGVPLCTDRPLRDSVLGTVVATAGPTLLTGDQALGYVRARHVEGDPTSDYGRIQRQQRFLSALLRKTLSAGTLLDVGKLRGLVAAVSSSTFGENVGSDQLLALGRSLGGVAARDVDFVTVPTTGVANGRGNEVLRGADDRALFSAIIDGTPLPGQAPAPGAAPAPPPVTADRVAVRVLDSGSGGSSTSDGSGGDPVGASAVRSTLRGYGFAAVSGSGSGSGTGDGSGPVIRFSPDQAGAAATLGRAVPGARPVPVPGAGTLVLSVGGDPVHVVDPTAVASAPVAPPISAADDACH